MKPLLLTTIILLFFGNVYSQVTLTGTVYDITKKTPIQSVSVLSTSGKGTMTDSMGHYSITVHETDSIYFSFLNKATPKYAVKDIAVAGSFDISILTKIAELPTVFVKKRSYKLDSLQNREDYAKIFNYRKPGFRISSDPTPGAFGAGVGVDLDELINVFRFKKNKSMLAFQSRLIQEEQDKFVDHRFSKYIVKKLTGLTSPELEIFMNEYRPTYEMVLNLNELELGQFIVEAFKHYTTKK